MDDLKSSFKEHLKNNKTLVLAYSGGSDSAAMAHALLNAASNTHTIVLAHIHHGLQKEADDWAIKAQNMVEKYKHTDPVCIVEVIKVNLNLGPQISIEEEARKERYKALENVCHKYNSNIMILGHHLRDQAETFLLQSARGSGVQGLSAMPVEQKINGINRVRPWLNIKKELITDYLIFNKIEYIEDPSNTDTSYSRNFIRQKLLPEWKTKVPAIDLMLARSAMYCSEATQAMNLLAEIDLNKYIKENTLIIDNQLPNWRLKNLIRKWCKDNNLNLTTHLTEILVTKIKDNEDTSLMVNKKLNIVLKDNVIKFESILEKTKEFNETLEIKNNEFYIGNNKFIWLGPIPAVIEFKPKRDAEKMSLGVNRPIRPIKKQYQNIGLSSSERETHAWYYNDTLLYTKQLGMNFAQPYIKQMEIKNEFEYPSNA